MCVNTMKHLTYPEKKKRLSANFSGTCKNLVQYLSDSIRTLHSNQKPKPMNITKPGILLGTVLVLGISMNEPAVVEKKFVEDSIQFPSEDYSPSRINGKYLDVEKRDQVFTPSDLAELGFPRIGEDLVIALRNQIHVLESSNFKDDKAFGNLNLTYEDMLSVIQVLLEKKGRDIHQYLEAQEVWGTSEHKGHVFFTGYYTPELTIRKQKSSKFKYPIYAYPTDWEGQLPSRKEIDGEGALEGLGLELGYAADPVDIAAMQLQGSGYVEYEDTGEEYLFRYAGQNGHPYRNIQRFFTERKDIRIGDISYKGIKQFLQQNPELKDSVLFTNPSYTFFAPEKGLVKGSGDVPLMKGISIAADPDFFPPGSVLLAALPVADDNGHVTHHEYRILLPRMLVGLSGEQVA